MYGNDDAFTKSGYDVMKDALAKLGIETLTTETFGGKDTDFSAQLTKIKSAEPRCDRRLGAGRGRRRHPARQEGARASRRRCA